MKLVIATPLYPPELGGPATYTKILEEHLGAPGDEIILVKWSDYNGYPKGIRHVRYMFAVLYAARNSDCVLALDPFSVGLPALIAAQIAHKPLVVKIVGDYAWEQGKQRFGVTASLDQFVRQTKVPLGVACFRAGQTYVARRARSIIVPSEYLKGIVERWGVSGDKIVVIYNSVELPHTMNAQKDTTTESSNNSNEIITIGRLVPWKGMEGVIEAVAAIKEEMPNIHLSIVGEGPDKEKLMKKGEQLLGSSISFTGALAHEQTLILMQQARIFVLNSSYEGMSHVLIEALSQGKAIVAADAGGNVELIEDSVNGILVPVGNTDALKKAINNLLRDKALCMTLSKSAKDSSIRFSVHAMITKTHELLTSL